MWRLSQASERGGFKRTMAIESMTGMLFVPFDVSGQKR